MSKLSTLNYLVNSIYAEKKEVEILQFSGFPSNNFGTDSDDSFFEPSQNSINKILSFALQYEVLISVRTGSIELNLN